MNKRSLVTVGVLLGGAFGLSCVSPFYGTARIEPGWHLDAGVAATTFTGGAVGENPGYYFGGRGDIELSYGFSDRFNIHGRAGLGLGAYPFPSQQEPGPWPISPLIDPSIGFQAAFPLGYVTPALRVDFPGTPVPVKILMGIGKPERVTLGVDLSGLFLYGITRPKLGISGFAGIHFNRNWSLFAGGGIPRVFFDLPLFTLGVGYKIK